MLQQLQLLSENFSKLKKRVMLNLNPNVVEIPKFSIDDLDDFDTSWS